MNLEYIKLQQDKDGADPQELRRILQDRVKHNQLMPKVSNIEMISYF